MNTEGGNGKMEVMERMGMDGGKRSEELGEGGRNE